VSSCARVRVNTDPEIVALHFSSLAVPGEITTKNGSAPDGQPVVAASVAEVSPDAKALVIVVWAAAPLYCLRVTAAIGSSSYTTHNHNSSTFKIVGLVGIDGLANVHLNVLHHHGVGLFVLLIGHHSGVIYEIAQ